MLSLPWGLGCQNQPELPPAVPDEAPPAIQLRLATNRLEEASQAVRRILPRAKNWRGVIVQPTGVAGQQRFYAFEGRRAKGSPDGPEGEPIYRYGWRSVFYRWDRFGTVEYQDLSNDAGPLGALIPEPETAFLGHWVFASGGEPDQARPAGFQAVFEEGEAARKLTDALKAAGSAFRTLRQVEPDPAQQPPDR